MLTRDLAPAAVVAAPTTCTIVREVAADLETPVSVYLKLAGPGPSFLLESVTGGEQVGRYSFIGVEPRRAYVLQAGCLARYGPDGMDQVLVTPDVDPLDLLRAELTRLAPATPVTSMKLPPFTGGLVGYLAYETVRYFEPTALPDELGRDASLPEAAFLLADTVIAFDHAYGRMVLIANAEDTPAGRAEAEARLDTLQARLAEPVPTAEVSSPGPAHDELQSNLTPDEFIAAVATAKEHIAAGDIFQVVLSQRFSRRTSARPFDIYRALRRLNPSPYMFFFDFAGLVPDPSLYLIGASPEVHVRLQGRQAELRPIAGTRPRGTTAEADAVLEGELLADAKERAEHVMLVDLARNDLGRVCEYGSVSVPELMVVERYSHVMHIVSHVRGKLRPEYDAFDLLRATFPAGTVSGAPKIRAMQIINRLEPELRGPYAGAVGYFSYDGNLDTCITIRTLVMRGNVVSVQAGAGIVADSEPETEYQETVNKARALAVAVARAEGERS